MNYIIGVDAGGTKTQATAFDLKGSILASCSGAFGNLVINRQQGTQNIVHTIRECLGIIPEAACVFICVGAAGIEAGDNKQYLYTTLISEFEIPLYVTNDADLALFAMLKGEDGILQISGTGSIAYGKKADTVMRCGGWGHILGDEGSGYWIGKQVFKNMVHQYDNGQDISSLVKRVLEHLNINDITHGVKFVYSTNKEAVASVVPIVEQEAKRGDSEAIRILEKAGVCLGEMTLKLYDRLGIGDIKIALRGSVLLKTEIVNKTFKNTVSKRIFDPVYMEKDIPSTLGAYYIYRYKII